MGAILGATLRAPFSEIARHLPSEKVKHGWNISLEDAAALIDSRRNRVHK